MTRDYSAFLPPHKHGHLPDRPAAFLETYGWQAFFAQQISIEALVDTPPVRVVEVHRNALHVLGDGIDRTIPPIPDVTVGDWLLMDKAQPQASRALRRKTVMKRRAPGTDRQEQLIAANIDTCFVVTSCNQDFSVARLERYVALAFEAGIAPVIVLTKSDQVTDAQAYVDPAREISDRVPVIALDARGDEPRRALVGWCKPGQTVAFLGSSGVGKSTLTNALAGTEWVATQAIREDDAKGRHTTTRRQLHLVPGGCLVLDTPGMRELQLAGAASGIDDLFADISDLSQACRFNDCAHVTEPGCAVLSAVETGALDAARLRRWRKLVAEDAFNAASLAERRNRDKSFGKMVRQVMKEKSGRTRR
ncbi:ribosome small subunit-dependent GTPase A [Ruegeria sp. 2012CJ41-6]|uniref:Small ribosomal subunit biogenesis GTPase RsgA n=1 Tax=Ruegeria spongiae TaxID=2942209 RepID=A0ABT0Q559_9RHOB|nr:ribosome small subunit-dependent GTPase A [Ruegeria spongiae]MCL6284044.1 ribosome small subunit-dependent GTPase A [Ruegeria spongiae]